MRPKGSTLITEDVCFPPERLAQGARDIQELLSKHGFIPGVAGHAAHGNLHFTLVADFGDPEGHKRYAAFMTELVDLVVRKHDGSLKAEHGTGLNMAPFVESEWGAKATAMMWRIKELADPKGILGPNVILTRNAKLHLENLKSVPQIESVTGSSQCIECGFCEPVCPSRNVTMTPRQRIVLRREMARQSPGSPMLAQLQQEYQYDGIETCAGDGTCAIPCPIGINTGALIREFRAMETTSTADKVALRLAKNWSTVEKVSRASLSATHAFSALFGVEAADGLDRGCASSRQSRSDTQRAGSDASGSSGSAVDPKERCRSRLLSRLHQPDVWPRSGRPGFAVLAGSVRHTVRTSRKAVVDSA